MRSPSLLYLGDRRENALAAPGVFADLHLDFLPEPARAILGAGASPEEITARQAVFRLLDESPETVEQFRSVSGLLTALGQLIRRMETFGNAAGEDFVFAEIARTAVKLAAVVRRMRPEGRTMTDAVAYMTDAFNALWFRDLVAACGASGGDTEPVLRLRMMQLPIAVTAYEGERFPDEWTARTYALGAEPAPDKRHGKRIMPPSFADALAKLYPERYLHAHAMREKFAPQLFGGDFDLHALLPLSEEIDFYLQTHALVLELRAAGYPMTFPALTDAREVRFRELYDLTLHNQGVAGASIVPNDLTLSLGAGERENFFLLTGANGGGKTTYLRAAAVACLLFLNGCPVPCRGGSMGHFTKLYTHFPTDEDYRDAGRFADEVRRAEEITENAGDSTLAFLNETFSGTDEAKSEDASRKLATALFESGTFGVYVTHLHELTGGDVPTLAAVIDENDNNRRTFRIVRMRRTDSSHAADILYRYGLTREQLREALARRKGAEA